MSLFQNFSLISLTEPASAILYQAQYAARLGHYEDMTRTERVASTVLVASRLSEPVVADALRQAANHKGDKGDLFALCLANACGKFLHGVSQQDLDRCDFSAIARFAIGHNTDSVEYYRVNLEQ